MWSVLALGAAESLINRVIDFDAITRIKIDALQGQCLRVVIDAPALSIDMYFDIGKLRFEPTPLGHADSPSLFEQRPFDKNYTVSAATATLHVADVVNLFKLLLSKEDELGNIPLQGDYHLLFAIKDILSQVELDLAAHLSPWIGATLAHEIGKLQNIPKQAVKAVKSAEFILVDSIKENSGLFAYRWQYNDLQKDTRTLNQNIDRLEARLQQLDQQLTSSK